MARTPFPIAFAAAAAGIAFFSAMDAVMKGLSLVSGAYLALLWRSFAGVVLCGLPHLWRRPARPDRHMLRLHLQRGVVVSAMAFLFFWGLARVPMAQAIALCFIAPLVALILAGVLLGERIGRETILGSGLAFLGVSAMLTGELRGGFAPSALAGTAAILLSALCYAYNLILMRRQAQGADPLEVATWQHGITALCFLLFAPWLGAWPAWGQLPAIGGAALLATISLLFLSWAYRRAEANRLAASEYTGFVWAALFGWIVFGETVRAGTLAGAGLIVMGCLIGLARRAPPGPERALD